MVIFLKDPEAVLDYKIDWSAWLGIDVLITSAWTVPAGITTDSDTSDATSTTIWLSGGTIGQSYELTNHITTASGREDDRTITIMMVQK